MRRLITILTAFMLLTACSGGLGSLVKKDAVCINSLQQANSKSAVCDFYSEAEDDNSEEETPAPTLLTSFMLNR